MKRKKVLSLLLGGSLGGSEYGKKDMFKFRLIEVVDKDELFKNIMLLKVF